MGGFKSIKKFFKKLGHQISTNWKHGKKYIVPILVSALTGGFGSSIVQGLFGGKVAGALSGVGNKLLGGIFGGGTSAGSATAKAISDASSAASNTASGVASNVLGSVMPAGMGTIPSIVAPTVGNVVGGSLSDILSAANSAKIANEISNSTKLVNRNPLLGKADKTLGNLINSQAMTSMTGAMGNYMGTAPKLSSSSGGGAYTGDVTKIKPFTTFNEDTESTYGDVSDAEKDRFRQYDELKNALREQYGITDEEDEEYRKRRNL